MNDLTRWQNRPIAAPVSVAPGIRYLRILFVNAYLVGDKGQPWILVDTGLPYSASRIRKAAEQDYGAGARPEAIILTHGHFDHAGSAMALAREWDVPIYAHRLEMPYLTGKSDYPPPDPTVGGTLGFLSRFFPSSGYDFADRVRPLPEDGSVPGAPGWRWLHTPGHTAGHVSLFRDSDRVLLAGDALATMNQESPVTNLTYQRELRRPPAPFTTDWSAARESLDNLAALAPATIAAGHGLPMTGGSLPEELRRFARHFSPPAGGRYTREAARTNEAGVVSLPPPVADPLPVLAGAALAALATAFFAARRGKEPRT